MNLNKKGYMLVEIVIASVLAMGIAYYLLDLTYNFKDKAEDLYYSYLYTKDKVLITKNIKSDLEQGTVIDITTNEQDNTKEINFFLKIPDNPTPQPRKMKFSKNSNGKTTIEYGKTTNNNFIENDVSYYKKELQSSLIIGDLDFQYSGEKSSVTINIPIQSIYDDKHDYSIKIYSEYYEPNYMKEVVEGGKENKYFRQTQYLEKILNVYFVDYINKSNAINHWGISENEDNPERITAWLQHSNNSGYYNLYIGSHDIIYARSLYSLFKDMTSIQTINFDNIDTSLTTNMSQLFHSCKSLKELDLSGFDTSNVTTMSGMFLAAGYNNTDFKLILGNNFDTSQVTRMDLMFWETGYNSTNFKLDLGAKFDTSNVTNMNSMFYYTGYKSNQFVLNLKDKFNTSNVTNMRYMFYYTGYKSNQFALNLGDKFDTYKVTDMNRMFSGIGYNSNSFILDLGDKFNTSNVTNMNSMFESSKTLNTIITIKNPNATYDKMFNGAATANGAKIIVNYTNETSDLVERMIETKYDTSNVVKGSLVN